MGRAGRTDDGYHIMMMSFHQYENQVRSQDLARLEENNLAPMILRSLASGRSFARMPCQCPPDPLVHLRAKDRTFLHGMLDSRGVTQMGHAVAAMGLPCTWAQFLYTYAERGLEDSALIIIATGYREGSGMTQQFYMNCGHPNGDIMTSLNITGSVPQETTTLVMVRRQPGGRNYRLVNRLRKNSPKITAIFQVQSPRHIWKNPQKFLESRQSKRKQGQQAWEALRVLRWLW